jgi:hypothetical protein
MCTHDDGICANRRWWKETLRIAESGPPWQYATDFRQVLAPLESGNAFFQRWILKAHPDKKKIFQNYNNQSSYPTIDDVLALRRAHRALVKSWPAMASMVGTVMRHEEPPSSSSSSSSSSSLLTPHHSRLPFADTISLIIVGITLMKAFTRFVDGVFVGCRRRHRATNLRTATGGGNGSFYHHSSRCASPKARRI